jgi:cation transport ATPase
VSAASQLTPSEEALAAAARALDAELWDEAEQLLVDYAKRVEGRRGEIKALNEETENLARQAWWRRYTPARRARARSLRLRAEELGQAADSEKQDYQRRCAELREKISHRQSQQLADGWRHAAFSLGGLWVVQAVLLIFGGHVTNHTHMGFYAGAVAVFPVLVIAGFVEIAVMARSPSDRAWVFWRMLSLVIPAVAGTMGCLWALAYERSTYVTLADVIVGLVFTVTVVLGMVVTTRVYPTPARSAD